MGEINFDAVAFRHEGKAWTYNDISNFVGISPGAAYQRVRKRWTPNEVLITKPGRSPDRLRGPRSNSRNDEEKIRERTIVSMSYMTRRWV